MADIALSSEADNNLVPKKDAEGADDVHAEALKRYERGYNHDRYNIEAAFDDLEFCIPENQWSFDDKKRREGRAQLVVDKTAQFVRQVTGDMRQMRPSIKVVPVDERGDKEVASKILPGMIRYIEQRSDAQAAYFQGADSQVRCGIGHWRVLTEYAHTDTFLQEIRIAPIDDGVSVIWDSDAALPTREDAKWCFVPVDITADGFKERWPDKNSAPMQSAPVIYQSWSTVDTVRIAEYWTKEPITRQLARMPGGGVDDVTGDPEAERQAIVQGGQIEEREDFKVVRYLISASDILEGPTDWPGRYIPVVPIVGEEFKKGKETIRRGIVRGLKDIQRLYNYSISQQCEVIALRPKAPFTGTKKNFEEFIDEWETANSENQPFLRYVPDPTNGGAAPRREPPPQSSSGIDDLLNRASQDYSAVTGIYPASLGQASNESSGKAILARQREGDTGTYHYIDNFGRAIRHTGKIVVDLIPHIYDTQRTIRIVGEDGKVDLMQINQAALGPDGMTPITLNDVTVGAYDVAIEMGPSFSTKKEEARDGMQTLMQSGGPQFAMLFADLFAKMQDWPLADKIAKRAHLMLPPAVQQMEAQDNGEPPPPQAPPPPPTPEQQAAMQKQQMDANKDQRQQEIDHLKAQAALASIQNELLKSELALAQARAGAMEGLNGPMQGPGQTGVNQPPSDPRVDEMGQTMTQVGDMVNRIAQHVGLQEPPMNAQQITDTVGNVIAQHTQNLAQMHHEHTNAIMQGLNALQQQMAQPKRRIPVRDPKTQRILHVDEVPAPPGGGIMQGPQETIQ